MARTASDAPSKEAGGAVGPIDPQTLPDALREALAKLAAGDVRAPVRTDQGYWLLKLERVSAPRPATIDALRTRVVVELLARKQASAFAATMKRLRAEALIAWKDRALKAAYEALPIAQ